MVLMNKNQQGFSVGSPLLLITILIIVATALFPIDRTCSKKGYSCAQPPRQKGQVACYEVSRKPLILDLINVGLGYSTFLRCN